MKTRTLFAALAATLIASGLSVADQTAKTDRLMKEKLVHTQRILEALTTSNYTLLNQEVEGLSRVVESARWDELRTPEFGRYSDAFSKATHDLLDASRRRDLDAAAADYGTVITTCYSCHRYRKASRLTATQERQP